FPSCFFFFNDTATTEIYTLSLHDALPIYARPYNVQFPYLAFINRTVNDARDRNSTRLNSSHVRISYAVFCLKKNIPPGHRERALSTCPLRGSRCCTLRGG